MKAITLSLLLLPQTLLATTCYDVPNRDEEWEETGAEVKIDTSTIKKSREYTMLYYWEKEEIDCYWEKFPLPSKKDQEEVRKKNPNIIYGLRFSGYGYRTLWRKIHYEIEWVGEMPRLLFKYNQLKVANCLVCGVGGCKLKPLKSEQVEALQVSISSMSAFEWGLRKDGMLVWREVEEGK